MKILFSCMSILGTIPSFNLNIRCSKIMIEPTNDLCSTPQLAYPTPEIIASVLCSTPQLVSNIVASLNNLYNDSDFDVTFSFSGVDLPLDFKSEDEPLESMETFNNILVGKANIFDFVL